MDHPLLLLTAVFPLLVIMAAMKDATTFTIPNWISIALVVAFYPVALALHAPLSLIGTCTLVGLAALLVGLVMFALNWIGGGDAKVLAASALWIGWPAVLPFVLATAVAGGALALLLLEMRSTLLRPWFERGPPWIARLATEGGDAPYGVAICVGALFALPQSALFRVG
ncbi:MAG: prepilin peptidase [Parcubacteria group bacterium]